MPDLQQSVPLPEAIIVKGIQDRGRDNFSLLVAGAIEWVLSATPSQRIALMQMAIPVIEKAQEDGSMYTYPVIIDTELMAIFTEYCMEMRLRPEPLVIGALMLELGLKSLPTNLPKFSDVCDDSDNS